MLFSFAEVEHPIYLDLPVCHPPVGLRGVWFGEHVWGLVAVHQPTHSGVGRIQVLHHLQEARELTGERGPPSMAALTVSPYIYSI